MNIDFFSQILSENKIGPDGAIALCELLSKNKTIIHLNLSGILCLLKVFMTIKFHS
jgi:hypothetical protein